MHHPFFLSLGILSLFFDMDPGFELYVGNIRVFDFPTHGVQDEVINWCHSYSFSLLYVYIFKSLSLPAPHIFLFLNFGLLKVPHLIHVKNWHEYRIKMNNSEVEEHRIEASDPNIVITIRVIQK